MKLPTLILGLILVFSICFPMRAYVAETATPVERGETMNLSLTEKLAYSTVRIEVTLNDGQTGTGTGFFFRLLEENNQHVPVIVTNWHVVKGTKRGLFHMTLADDKGNPQEASHKGIEIWDFEKYWIRHPNPEVDLAAMPIAPLLHEANKSSMHLFYISLDKSLIPSESDISELTAVEDILMVGYPTGIWDTVHNFPVFRKGITATHPAKDYNGRKEFMIDAACFPGSSGSPVFLYNIGNYVNRSGGTVIGSRFKFLGVLYAGPQYTATGEIKIVEVPTKQVPIVALPIPTNLGNVIKSETILDFEEVFKNFERK